MTMFRQIAALFTLGFFLLLALVSYDNLKQSTTLLQGQLETTVQDTATVLGIALTATGAGNDNAALETLFNAVFDSGYYSEIRFTGIDGKLKYGKQRLHSVDGVPEWFIDAIDLESAAGRADVMDGWVPLGTLEITLHPGYAYAGLYSRLSATLGWFSVVFLGILVLLWVVLHYVLQPLNQVYRQAQDIQRNRFTQLKNRPRTRELRRVIEAMNRLSKTVERIFNDQNTVWEQYQNLLYHDELTGLRNRRSLLADVEYCLSEKSVFQGNLILFRLEGLEESRSEDGYEFADQALMYLGAILASFQGGRVQSARVGEDEFAMLLSADVSECETLIRNVFERFSNRYPVEALYLVAAISDVYGGRELSAVFSELDLNISRAREMGPFQYCFPEERSLSLPQGRQEWRSFLLKALDEGRFYLVAQPVVGVEKDRFFHREIFVRLDDRNGSSIPASIFMAMASSLDMDAIIYRRVTELIHAFLGKHTGGAVAVNFPESFVQNVDAFREFTRYVLDAFKGSRDGLCVEVAHTVAVKNLALIEKISEQLQEFGFQFGLDHVDPDASIDLLREINPGYIKINARLLGDVLSGGELAGYHALRSVTRALDIDLIVVGVEDEELRKKLIELDVDGMQGNLLYKAERVE